MKKTFLFLFVIQLLSASYAIADEEPLKNPFLADSPWPTFHRNNYAQASTSLRGPEPGDKIVVQFIETQSGKIPVSPWIQLSEKYPSGERVAWGVSLTHAFKVLVFGATFKHVDSYQIDELYDKSVNWNFFIYKGNKVFVLDPQKRRILRFADSVLGNPSSKIALEAQYVMPASLGKGIAQFNLSYDGKIIFLTPEGWISALEPDFSNLVSFDIKQATGDINFHNAFALDNDGGIYIVSNNAMTKLRWDGKQFSLIWRVPYNFKGPGCLDKSPSRGLGAAQVIMGLRCTGSGTTPTLVGKDGDKLVVVVDSHEQNNLVAFWRDEIPTDWQGLTNHDKRIAAITPLPYSTWRGQGYTAENSPPVWGYEIAVAQWNGFTPSCDPLPGVQKLRWNPEANEMQLAWATDKINMNGVLTYSSGSNLVYGSGRRNCTYYYWGVDWNTGEVKLEIPLGNDPKFLDQGNQHVINDDRSILFATWKGLIRIFPNSGDAR